MQYEGCVASDALQQIYHASADKEDGKSNKVVNSIIEINVNILKTNV